MRHYLSVFLVALVTVCAITADAVGQSQSPLTRSTHGVVEMGVSERGLRISVRDGVSAPAWWARAISPSADAATLRAAIDTALVSWKRNEEWTVHLPTMLPLSSDNKGCSEVHIANKSFDLSDIIGGAPDKSLLATQRIAAASSSKWVVFAMCSSNTTSGVNVAFAGAKDAKKLIRHSIPEASGGGKGGRETQVVECVIVDDIVVIYLLNSLRASVDIVDLNRRATVLHCEVDFRNR